jgi:hypothetical protein
MTFCIKNLRSAKLFLDNAVPTILEGLGVNPELRIFGFPINIELQLRKKIGEMTEEQALKAVELLKETFDKW